MKAVLWDLDGTLIDSEPVYAAATQDVLSAQGVRLDAAFINRMIGRSLEELMQEFKTIYGIEIPMDYFEQQMVAAFITRREQVRRLPTADLYAALRDKGVLTAIVTNSERIIVDMNLQTTDLQKPASITVCRNDVRNAKPDPEPYLRAAYLLGVAPEACLVIEDSSAGAQAGLAANMRVLGFNHMDLGIDAEGAVFPKNLEDLMEQIKTWIQ